MSGRGLRRFLCLTALICAACPDLRAERLPIKIFTTADGLAHNDVNRIVKDSRGFLSFCTAGGLSGFDGYAFTNFSTEQGLPHSNVNDLLETRGGDYWVATTGVLRPWFLPDGKRFLYTARLDDGEGEARLAQLRLNDREGNARPVQLEEDTRTLMSASSNAPWVDPDLVVFVREGVLMGQRVDAEAARPVAEPFPIVEPVEYFCGFLPSKVTGDSDWANSWRRGQSNGVARAETTLMTPSGARAARVEGPRRILPGRTV